MSEDPGIRPTADGVEIDLKVVPGARENTLAGMLGPRVKVRVSSPPEGGRANQAVFELLAECLRVPARDITLTRGATTPFKTVLIRMIDVDSVRDRLL